jgi:hypothetical protein
MKVRVNGADHGDILLEAFWTLYLPPEKIMIDVVGRYKLVLYRQVSLVPYLFNNTAAQRLVFFC